LKIHDCSKINRRDTKSQRGLLKRFQSSHTEPSATERFINYLNSGLDLRFHLLCDVSLDDHEAELPLVLVGPTGLWLIQFFTEKGIFKISEADCLQLDEKSGRLKPINPNPITDLLYKSQRLTNYLSDMRIPSQSIEPLLFFSHPGAHVDIDSLSSERISDPPDAEIQDAYSLRDLAPHKKPRQPTQLEKLSREEPGIITKISNNLPLSHQQWILLGILIIVNIVILLALVFIVVFYSGG
jgi:hypothetical protein